MTTGDRKNLFIDGTWRPSHGHTVIEVVDPASEETLATVPAGDADDVADAVAAARRAFPAWSLTPPADRAALCASVANGLAARADEIADLASREVGMVRTLSRLIQADGSVAAFASVPALVADFNFEERLGTSLVVREPVGVVGCITAWNYPLPQAATKVATALAAGCTVVLKPSEVAPLSAFLLAEVLEAAGLPPGVFNLVSGAGTPAGEALAAHPDVDMISFTGSTRSGKRIAALCSERVARTALELGGKSANIILEGADLPTAVRDGVGKAFLNSGQTCSALTRMVVPRARLPEVEAIAAERARRLSPGNPFDATSRLGPLASRAQWERVQAYIQKGIDEGARVVQGGLGRPDGLDCGFYVKPTIFSDVDRRMTIAQEEIFGPVLTLIAYEHEAEAIEIANDSLYGLSGAVWGPSQEHAIRVARQIRTGQVEINGGPYNPLAPFGGYKQSGTGREYGPFGLSEYLEVKSLQL